MYIINLHVSMAYPVSTTIVIARYTSIFALNASIPCNRLIRNKEKSTSQIFHCNIDTYKRGPKGGSVYGFTKKIKPIYGLRR